MANTPMNSATPSVDLPDSIDNLFDFALEDVPVSGPAPAAAPMNAPAAGVNQQVGVQGFAEGGMVEPVDTGVAPEGGVGLAVPGEGNIPGGAPGADVNIEAEAKRVIRENPQVAAQMLQAAEDALQMGEFTEEMIEQGGKMAVVVARNPEMYPKMLQKLSAMGASDLPPEYDPEFIMTVIMMWLAWQQKDQIRAGGAGAPAKGSIPEDQIQDFAKGGYVKPMDHAAGGGMVSGPGTGTSDSIPINVSTGEYVIPAHIVKSKGKEFFDNMISKYDPDKQA